MHMGKAEGPETASEMPVAVFVHQTAEICSGLARSGVRSWASRTIFHGQTSSEAETNGDLIIHGFGKNNLSQRYRSAPRFARRLR